MHFIQTGAFVNAAVVAGWPVILAVNHCLCGIREAPSPCGSPLPLNIWSRQHHLNNLVVMPSTSTICQQPCSLSVESIAIQSHCRCLGVMFNPCIATGFFASTVYLKPQGTAKSHRRRLDSASSGSHFALSYTPLVANPPRVEGKWCSISQVHLLSLIFLSNTHRPLHCKESRT